MTASKDLTPEQRIKQLPHQLLHGQSNDCRQGRDRLFRILATHCLLVLPKRAHHKTTDSFYRFYRPQRVQAQL